MKSFIRKLIKNNKGSTTVLMAMIIIILIAMSGIVIDLGLLIEGKARLHGASKAAILAGFDAYDMDKYNYDGTIEITYSDLYSIVETYLDYNMSEAYIYSLEIYPDQLNKARLITRYEVPFYFMKLFGVDSKVVEVTIDLTIYESEDES